MPVYMLYGFKWPRAGFTGIRVYIVLHNLEDATAEYLQTPITTQLLLGSFAKTEPGIVSRLPDLRFIEQYDPDDTSDEAVSKPYAYVAGKVITMPESGALSLDAEELVKESGLEDDAMAALTEMRDKYAAGEKIGWYIVYNGDPERWFPQIEEDDDESMMYEDEDGDASDYGSASQPPSTPTAFFPQKLTQFFGTKKIT
ncbi:developmental regulator FlbE [Aspergillus bombycis]|uniref:Developmental regulator FlbE n=1 Tax=Aspergillus bombycis TaxID=109264 RepID=A0A1F8AA18_9EURO|nr:developmental regulator FlbE [Aspergillus bombycis]OGM48564.1 developmental regulator FlbE [Aspergillus bombycis]